MSYGDFSLEGATRAFALAVVTDRDLFAEVPEVPIGPLLKATLDENISLATSIHTEKARSEMIVAPILIEVRRRKDRKISLFSGIEFSVAPEEGLNGFCDFILSLSPMQMFLEAPVLTVVEAKNDNIKAGFGQCVAEMVAARKFNERQGRGPARIHGLVTTGSLWRFLRLDGGTLIIDRTEYYLDRVDKILGILLECVGGAA